MARDTQRGHDATARLQALGSAAKGGGREEGGEKKEMGMREKVRGLGLEKGERESE